MTGALAMACVSTLGDFIWASYISQHRLAYGMAHGMLLFLFVGLFLGTLAKKPVGGALSGMAIGGIAATSFYLLAPSVGYSIMFVIWFAIWMALGGLHGWLDRRQIDVRSVFGRGALAAAGSGLAFYGVSGIWSPFNPRGWDYLVHFAAWTFAFLPGFAALLVRRDV